MSISFFSFLPEVHISRYIILVPIPRRHLIVQLYLYGTLRGRETMKVEGNPVNE
jgi:hypothetical protein